MHEMSIAESIIDIVSETLNGQQQQKLLSVTVRIGELTAVVPESLQFCFEMSLENTPFEGAQLIIEEVPLRGECKKCSAEFKIENYNFICPVCRSVDVKVTGGQELNVSELEVE